MTEGPNGVGPNVTTGGTDWKESLTGSLMEENTKRQCGHYNYVKSKIVPVTVRLSFIKVYIPGIVETPLMS